MQRWLYLVKELLKNVKTSTIKKIICCLAAILLFSGYTFVDESPYLIINCSLGNNIKIYFNTSSADNKLVYDKDQQLLINVTGSSVTGYIERNNEQYSITFPVYDVPYYRTSNNYTYVYITNVTEIVKNHNVRFYKTLNDETLMFSAVAILLFFIFLKR